MPDMEPGAAQERFADIVGAHEPIAIQKLIDAARREGGSLSPVGPAAFSRCAAHEKPPPFGGDPQNSAAERKVTPVSAETHGRRSLMNAKSLTVPLGDTEMDCAVFGAGERSMVLIPGLSDGLMTVKGRAWLLAGPYRRFWADFTVYVCSRPNTLPEGCSIRDMAAYLAAAMERLGMESACVMGVSQGGMIAQYLAAEHPRLVEKLVLAVTAPRANDKVQAFVRRSMDLAEKGDHRQLMIESAEQSYSEKRLRKLRLSYPVLGRIGKPESYRRYLINAAAILAFDGGDILGKISCPTLILGGEEDKVVGAEGSRELHAAIPGSELYLYPGLGHASYEEGPDFNERVYRFFTA